MTTANTQSNTENKKNTSWVKKERGMNVEVAKSKKDFFVIKSKCLKHA